MAPPRKISHSCSAGVLPTFAQLKMGGDGVLLVPAPTRLPSAHHGYAHIPHGTQLLRVWVEVRGSGLHVYPHRASSIPSLVVPHLHLCHVTVAPHTTSSSYRVQISLKGEEQVSLFLQAESEANVWAAMLRVTAVKRSLQLEGLNLECGTAGEHDPGSGDSCEAESQGEEEEEEDVGGQGASLLETAAEGGEGKVRLRRPRLLSHDSARDDATRKELLQQMLATKSLLEKKQKNRRSGAGAWLVTAGEVANEYDRAQHEAQQSALRKVVILRQRKNSTAIKMATLERQQSSKKTREVADVSVQLEALRNRLSSLDTQLRESEQDTERMLQDLEHRRNQELHLIKDLGGVDEDLGGELGDVTKGSGSDEGNLLKGSHGGSFMGSLSSIPSIVVSSSERKAPEKFFGIKVGGREGRLKGRNPLHFLDLKLRVSRRHKSTECLTTPSQTHHTPDRSHSSTPANGSCSDNSSDDELDHQHQRHQQQSHHQLGATSVKTEISKEAIQEIEAFKELIQRYFATHPRHDSITAHSHEIIL
ncbi:uncharacterized protein [Procambarus clarkii]|uniref:uncharacterized protein n=1 Tax=Procambarus clarkii TaxID=6728 RepID=UPI001E671EA6|nr:uncharacterized protein LOC123757899 [Procambarus clarkii]XP_045597786.1 uncharacterized protein LOC123757899 [Procambarus clarkii]XP_045597787.1 uncharacterized protein LOC123757899 [Procambarus clarkii]XP_045597788.1 uncharacterized protein LOC123757899 [Procambarus clarkii]XP_045597789.1 uncharacterized protein LOC123757899 [Procambarus clarkii]